MVELLAEGHNGNLTKMQIKTWKKAETWLFPRET